MITAFRPLDKVTTDKGDQQFFGDDYDEETNMDDNYPVTDNNADAEDDDGWEQLSAKVAGTKRHCERYAMQTEM